MAELVVVCPACQRAHAFTGTLSFRAECACGQDLHVCITCRFYDRYAENECREPTAEPVREKGRRNLCEDWRAHDASSSSSSEADRAKEKLAALFGGAKPSGELPSASGASEADLARAKLDALFKKK